MPCYLQPPKSYHQWRRVLSTEVVRAACWPSLLKMCAQCGSTISAIRPIVEMMMLTRPAPKISTPDYIETGDSYNLTSMSSQSHGSIIPSHSRPNGNRTGKLRVWLIELYTLRRKVDYAGNSQSTQAAIGR